MLASELREACEAVVNASPSDYEAACEVWTRVCTPQAVLAALKEAEVVSAYDQLLAEFIRTAQVNLNTMTVSAEKGAAYAKLAEVCVRRMALEKDVTP